MDLTLITLAILAVVCISLSLEIFFESSLHGDSVRDRLERKMVSLSQFLNKKVDIFLNLTLRPLEILFFSGIALSIVYRLLSSLLW